MLKVEKLNQFYGESHTLWDVDLNVLAGSCTCLMGRNGVGKTTLCRIITGFEKADGGSVEVGDTVDLAYVDQSRDALGGDRTVWEEISEGAEVIELGRKEVSSRAYCSWFNFKGNGQQQHVGELSGGERNRVHMAKLLKSGGNVLILDEPTNDLDVDTLRSLEDALAEFGGCSIIISHDRWFLDRLATHILAFEGDSQVEWFQGNYADYEADRRRRLGDTAAIPKRPKFRRLASMG